MTFLAAARKDVDAAVIYYGAEIETHFDEASYISAPLIVHYAEEDEYVPLPAQRAVTDVLVKLPNVRVFSYPGRCHGFTTRVGKHYDVGAATLANERTMDFLKQCLPLALS